MIWSATVKDVDFSKPSEAELSGLLAQIAVGDWAAFRSLFERYGGSLHGIAVALLGPGVEAEAATKQALLQIWRRAGTHDDLGVGARAWLISVVRDVAAAKARSLIAGGAFLPPPPLVPGPDWSTGLDPATFQDLWQAYLGRSGGVPNPRAHTTVEDVLCQIEEEGHGTPEAHMAGLHALGLLEFEQMRDAKARLQMDAVFVAEYARWIQRFADWAPITPAPPPDALWSSVETKLAHQKGEEARWARPLGLVILVLFVIYALFADPGWL